MRSDRFVVSWPSSLEFSIKKLTKSKNLVKISNELDFTISRKPAKKFE